MKDSEIHVGDVLRIKEWDDMVDEFEVDGDGDVKIWGRRNVPVWFFYKNKEICGQVFTVKAVEHLPHTYYRSEENVESDSNDYCIITCDMLEPFTDDEYELATDEDISMLFG